MNGNTGISNAPLPAHFPFGDIIAAQCKEYAFYPCLVGAIKLNETGISTDPNELQAGTDPYTGLLPDGSNGGRGPMQLTSSYPVNWRDPATNIGYAIYHFLIPALREWEEMLQGDDLVRAIAASYNAGFGNAERGHLEGDVDRYTTDRYGERALAHYHNLIGGRIL